MMIVKFNAPVFSHQHKRLARLEMSKCASAVPRPGDVLTFSEGGEVYSVDYVHWMFEKFPVIPVVKIDPVFVRSEIRLEEVVDEDGWRCVWMHPDAALREIIMRDTQEPSKCQ